MNILVIVDMQNDFIDGVFGKWEAHSLLSKITEFVKDFDGVIIATKDTHFSEKLSVEEKTLPAHCIVGEDGFEIPELLRQYIIEKKGITFNKHSFGLLDLSKKILQYLDKSKIEYSSIENIYMCGLCTDICVLNNALILRNGLYDKKITVLSDLCLGTTIENHQKALDLMKVNLIEVRESNEVQTNNK